MDLPRSALAISPVVAALLCLAIGGQALAREPAPRDKERKQEAVAAEASPPIEQAADIAEEAASVFSDLASQPIVLGGRVEVPEAGYALSVPDDWVAIHASEGDASAITEALATIDPELATMLETALASEMTFSLLAFGPLQAEASFQENCNVIDFPGQGATLELVVAAEVAALQAMGDRLASGPEVTMLELPAGRSARLDYTLEDDSFSTEHSSYYFTDGTMFHTLTCVDSARPGNAWRPIAKTFEFLKGGG